MRFLYSPQNPHMMAPPHYIATSQPMPTSQPASGQPTQPVNQPLPPPAPQTPQSPGNPINGEIVKSDQSFEGENSPVGNPQPPANPVTGNGFVQTGTRPGSANQSWNENSNVQQSSTTPPQDRFSFHRGVLQGGVS